MHSVSCGCNGLIPIYQHWLLAHASGRPSPLLLFPDLRRIILSKSAALVYVAVDDNYDDDDREDGDHVARKLTLIDLFNDRVLLAGHVWVPDQNVEAHQDLEKDHLLVIVDAWLLDF